MLRAHYGLAEDSGRCYSHLDPRLRVISGNWPVAVAQETKSMVNRVLVHMYTQTAIYHISFAELSCMATHNYKEAENCNSMFLEGYI